MVVAVKLEGWRRLTFVPHASAMAVAAITDTIRVFWWVNFSVDAMALNGANVQCGYCDNIGYMRLEWGVVSRLVGSS